MAETMDHAVLVSAWVPVYSQQSKSPKMYKNYFYNLKNSAKLTKSNQSQNKTILAYNLKKLSISFIVFIY